MLDRRSFVAMLLGAPLAAFGIRRARTVAPTFDPSTIYVVNGDPTPLLALLRRHHGTIPDWSNDWLVSPWETPE